MVLALVAGGVVVEDGLARWVRWQSGRRAPWAASSAALGVAVPDSECVHSQADVIHFIAWLAHELRAGRRRVGASTVVGGMVGGAEGGGGSGCGSDVRRGCT